MRKLSLYIATSLDNYIAREDGSVDWLFSATGEDYGYHAFLAGVDTILMGAKTYEFILNHGGDYPYPDQENYVFTRNKERPADPNVEFVTDHISEFVGRLKKQPGKTIWLVGGGQINTLMLNAGLIDEIILFIQPTVLGSGIPLFGGKGKTTAFELRSSKAYPSGMIELVLWKKNEHEPT
ncbi:MAG: dihydrofolate reductase [Saprospirales bacterium]|nr:dihydrofolate reductase [Saprospirales bacterium]